MNPYIIAPNLVTVNLDQELSDQFFALNGRLDWRPLTTNLESCEDAPYLYFRITLKLRPGATTYAGFATGAPFMLTRDKDVKKRAFFLRHWVRKQPPEDTMEAPVSPLLNMKIGAQDHRILVRVEIDRPLDTQDAFKSVPFATWMFQVVQVDALITELPGVRFAFAIERTVTAEERELVANCGRSMPAKGPKMKSLPPASSPPSHYSAPYVTPPAMSGPRPVRLLMGQSSMHPPTMHTPPMQQSVVVHRNTPYAPAVPRPQPVYQHNPYQYSSSRQIQPQMRSNSVPRTHLVTPAANRPVQRVYNRPVPPTYPTQYTPPVQEVSKSIHPYLRLWEDRDADDPYEPIFITKDVKFDTKARQSVVVEEAEEHSKRLDSQNLFGLPTTDYPSYFFEGPELFAEEGEPDLEVEVDRKPRVETESEVTNSSGDDNDDMKRIDRAKYLEAVSAAANYNRSLQNERIELSKWLVEEVAREQEESEEEEEEDDMDQDSSE